MIASAVSSPKPEPFFLRGSRGDLFSLYYPPHRVPSRGSLLYIHPFLEELEASRSIIATVAREIGKLGYGVLSVDLYGCGDSAGEFRDARWETWIEDLVLGVRWLRDRNGPRIGLWGLRLGSLLALDLERYLHAISTLNVLWHPPYAGVETLTHFFRRSLLQENDPAPRAPKYLKSRLASGSSVEIAGWELDPSLAAAIERLELTSLLSQASSAVHCAEFVSSAALRFAAARSRIFAAIEASGLAAEYQQLPVSPFWSIWSEGSTTDYQVLIEFMNGVLAKWAT